MMKLIVHLIFVLILLILTTAKVPTLPTAFEADWQLSIDIIDNGNPFFLGRIVTDYNNAGGVLRLADVSSSNVPYLLDTTLIGVPFTQSNITSVIGYLFYSEGRCWKIGEISIDEFHIIPDTIPDDAVFVRNFTVDGELCSEWTWGTSQNDEINIVVRYSDSAVLEISARTNFEFTFTTKIEFKRWSNNPSPDNWATPAGPCTDYSSEEYSGISFSLNSKNLFAYSRQIVKSFRENKLHRSLALLPFKTQLKHKKPLFMNQKYLKKLSTQDPTPPILAQQFSTDVTYGIGYLKKENNWRDVDILSGFIVTDKVRGGAYLSIHDAGDVPFLFSSSTIFHPFAPNNISVYLFEAIGRCWNIGTGYSNPDFPLRIPADATYEGQADVYGQTADLWTFVGDSPFGYSLNSRAAVVGTTPLFINSVYPDFENPEGGLYFIFTKFNSTQPAVDMYRVPPGPCPLVNNNK